MQRTRMISASSNSRHIQIIRTKRGANGRAVKDSQTLTRAQMLIQREAEAREEELRLAAMTEQQRREHAALRDIPDAYPDAWEDDYEGDVLRGRILADISHAGEGELLTDDAMENEEQTLLEKMCSHHQKLWGSKRDNRTRRDRTQILVDAFAAQMGPMTSAYIDWQHDTKEDGLGKLFNHAEAAVVEDTENVYVVDLFSAYYSNVPIVEGDTYIASALVRQGLIPCAAYRSTVAITVRTLEVFRSLQLRCPRLGIQAFVRALCDIHGAAPRPYLTTQFSVAFDVYLAIRAKAHARVQTALGRDTPNWRLENACPACMYKLENETPIPLPFLATIDGNNSLKRFWRREREEFDAGGKAVPGASKERLDNRVAPGDYYLSREDVDKWSKEGLEDLMRGFVPDSEVEDEGEGCTERWQNMKEDATARAYGMYDETGIFPALCRHGFVLVVVDMIKSGELAKYGFAVTAHLVRVLGELGLGYDIGCKFGKMVRMHPALSKLAADNNFRALVGAFHGHAHNRRCQLSNLATYVSGMGLEDLEGCESYFSKSNALAATTRYATAFHRQQAITTYMKHTDTADAYQGLSLLLANKYRRALKIKASLPLLRQTMASMGVATRSVFEDWLEKEKTYLASLTKEPEHETLQMEYYQKLVNLHDHEERLNQMNGVETPFIPAPQDTTYAQAAAQTRRIETQRRHAGEVHTKTLAAVQDLEIRLGVGPRWVPGDKEWEDTAAMVTNRRYQRALDELEGLVVARMFELSKVNMSDTGYKLRKHIAKALQARSKGVKSALDTYNTAAAALSPPRTPLTWDQIVDYAFLADFDLLREGREDIREEPWAQPGGRLAMDQHFKLLRADEEIARLNLEIPRFVTYMADEEEFLIHHELRLCNEGNPTLAHQVWLQRRDRSRFNIQHLERLVKLSKEPGFTASLIRGISVNKDRHVPPPSPDDNDIEMPDVQAPEDAPIAPPHEEGGEDPDDDRGDVDVDAVADALEHILRITT